MLQSRRDSAGARVLIANGAKVNLRSDAAMMPLHYAARNGCSEVARVLIEHGGDVDARNAQGETPLVLATWELKSWKKDGNAAVIKKYEETVSLLRQSEAK